MCCCWYHKGTNFQANHNYIGGIGGFAPVVADTTKVRIFKQITTGLGFSLDLLKLLLIPQRYEFSSKSQLGTFVTDIQLGCCWYHKGTNFQANHNTQRLWPYCCKVVADTTKVRIFKQITTFNQGNAENEELLLIPQRYEFSSKSQRVIALTISRISCCWYHKGTNFQANHNIPFLLLELQKVVADTTKVRIFKQITTFLQLACCW